MDDSPADDVAELDEELMRRIAEYVDRLNAGHTIDPAEIVAAVAIAGAFPLPDETTPDRGAYNRGHPRKKAGDPPDTGIDRIAEVVLAGQVLRS